MSIEMLAPAIGGVLQLLDGLDAPERQAAFKLCFYDVVGALHLALCPWIARLVGVPIHTQPLQGSFQ